MNKVFDVREVTKRTRDFNPEEIVKFLNTHTFKFWSWGAKNFAAYNNRALRFNTNGHHHKGEVVIVLNFLDLFDVYLLNKDNTIKEVLPDVYLEDLFSIMDDKIERVPEYKA
jgi:hypothetical protein